MSIGAIPACSGVVTAALSFVSPALAIAGFACIAVPIIIHLLTRQRRRPIEWAAMKFLLEAYRRHRRRLTIEQLVLLACRCLLVALVGVALARPVLDELATPKGPVHLYMLVDNSLASQLRDAGAASGTRSALDRSKERGAALLAELDSSRGDRAAVISLAAPANAVILPLSPDLSAVSRVLADLPAEAGRADVAGAVSRLRADLSDTQNAATDGPPARVVIAILSDLRAGSIDLSQTLPVLGTGPSAPIVRVLPAATQEADNIAVTGIEPLRPMIVADAGQTSIANPTGNQVRVSLARFGPIVSKSSSTAVKVSLVDARSLAESGVRAAADADAAVVNWQPGQEAASAIVQVRANASGAEALALVASIDQDLLPADDVYVRPVEGRRSVRVALIESLKLGLAQGPTIDRFSPGDWVRLVLQPDASAGPLRSHSMGLVPTTLDPASVGRSGLSGFDAAIVLAPDELTDEGWKRLGDFSRSGGLLLITPPAEATVHLWGEPMARELGLDWTIAREVQQLGPPLGLSPQAPGGLANPLVGMIAAEMPDLSKPVTVSRRLALTAPTGSLEPVVTLADGSPLVACSSPASGQGLVVLMTAAIQLGWTDLPTKPLMLPLLHEIVRVGVGRSQPSFDQTAGHALRLPPGTVELVPADDRASSSPGMSAAGKSPARYAGVWRGVNSQSAVVSLVAINPDHAASDITPLPSAQSRTVLAQIAGADRIADINGASPENAETASLGLPDPRSREPVSVPLLAVALGLALAEIALARAFSHAGRVSTSSPGGAA